MFDITFYPDGIEDGSQRGSIRIGAFQEDFLASLDYWSPHDYRAQWMEGIRRAIDARADSCLITSITDPEASNFIMWWPIYIDHAHAIFHNQLLFLDQCEPRFDVDRPYASLPPREIRASSEPAISTWRIALQELEVWVERQGM